MLELNDFHQIPPHMREGIILYTESHIPTGSFLQAVIENDLLGAVQCADNTNIGIIPVYVNWFYWHAPPECWGSEEAYKAWTTPPSREADQVEDETGQVEK
jgi:hypothetical protein